MNIQLSLCANRVETRGSHATGIRHKTAIPGPADFVRQAELRELLVTEQSGRVSVEQKAVDRLAAAWLGSGCWAKPGIDT